VPRSKRTKPVPENLSKPEQRALWEWYVGERIRFGEEHTRRNDAEWRADIRSHVNEALLRAVAVGEEYADYVAYCKLWISRERRWTRERRAEIERRKRAERPQEQREMFREQRRSQRDAGGPQGEPVKLGVSVEAALADAMKRLLGGRGQ